MNTLEMAHITVLPKTQDTIQIVVCMSYVWRKDRTTHLNSISDCSKYEKYMTHVSWCKPVVPPVGRLRQEDH